MADEIPLAPIADAAPVVEAPAVVEAPSVAAEPVVEAEPVADVAPVSAIESAPEPVVEAAPIEPEVAAEPVAPVYTDFSLPEGLSAAPEQVEAFTGVLGKYGLTQEAGQELMNLHATALKQAADAMAQRQQDVFVETRRGWVQQFDKGAGNRRDTILNDAKFAITSTITDAKERAALWQVLGDVTGAGDHPAVVNLLGKIGARLRERNAPPSPIPNNAAKSANPADRRYGPKI